MTIKRGTLLSYIGSAIAFAVMTISLIAATSFVSSALSYAAEVSSPSKGQTSAGWKELISSGAPFLGTPEELSYDINSLESFLKFSGPFIPAADRAFLGRSLSRMYKFAAIQISFQQCALNEPLGKIYLDRVLSGSRQYVQLECGLSSSSQLENFKQIANSIMGPNAAGNPKAARENLRSLARIRAVQNLSRLMTQVQQANPEELAEHLSHYLGPMSRELTRIKERINPQLKGLEADADQRAKDLFDELSPDYHRMYTEMVTSPDGNMALLKSMVGRIGFVRDSDDVEVVARGRVNGQSFIKIDIPNHPSSIDAATVREALAEEIKDLNQAVRDLGRNEKAKLSLSKLSNVTPSESAQATPEISLNDLMTKFPVSVGESLMEAHPEDLPDLLNDLCKLASAEGRKERMKKRAIKAVDIALAASSLVSGAGGAAAGFARRELAKRALLAGAGAIATGADASAMAQYAHGVAKRDEVLDLLRNNPAIAKNPDELLRVQKAIKEYKELERNAILTAGISSAGALGALTVARIFAKETDGPIEILEAAKRKLDKGPDAFDRFVGGLYSNSCKIR